VVKSGHVISFVVGVVVAAVIGGTIAAKVTESTAGRWVVLVVTGYIVELTLFVIYEHLLRTRREVEVPDPEPEFTQQVRDADWSYCAVSSKQVSLWESPTFLFYLLVNGVKSLLHFSQEARSPLKLSNEAEDKERFFAQSLELASQIAKGEPVVRFYGLRLLIYPEAMYSRENRDFILRLIQAHVLNRIHCIPIVLEPLIARLAESSAEAEALQRLRLITHHDPQESDVPRSPLGRLLRRVWPFRPRGVVVPDFLIIDNTDPRTAKTTLWWYEGKAARSSDKEEDLTAAARVFQLLCRYASAYKWTGFTPDEIDMLAAAEAPDGYGGDFFSRPYFTRWVQWIRDPSNSKLRVARMFRYWFEEEERILKDQLGANDEVLDVGCGYGRHLDMLLSDCGCKAAAGVDISPHMVLRAGGLRKKFGESKVQICFEDAAALNFSDNRFDAAICMTNTLGNIESVDTRANVIREMVRVVKPEGKIIISVYNDDEEVMASRKESYESIGLHVGKVRGRRALLTREGLFSEQFSRASLVRLLVGLGLSEPNVREVAYETDVVGLVAVATKRTAQPRA